MVEVITKYLKDVFDRDPRGRPGSSPTAAAICRASAAPRSRPCARATWTGGQHLGPGAGGGHRGPGRGILNGYPGTVAATWQRLGRAGRRTAPALGVLVATSDPLDQYLVRHPEFFLGASPEHARIHPDQLLILLDHVRCAAFELPFRDGESFGGEDLGEMLAYLRDEGVAPAPGRRWYWVADSYPGQRVSLRSVAEGNFVVIDTTGGTQDGHRGGGLVERPEHPLRGRHLHDPGAALPGGAPGLGGAQGLRHAAPRPTTTPTPSTTRGSRSSTASTRRARARGTCAHGEVHLVRRYPRLQEDPLLHPRQRRLRQHQPAGSGAAHHGGLVAGRAARAGRRAARPPAGDRGLPRRRLCPAPRRRPALHGRAAGPGPRGGGRRGPGRRRSAPTVAASCAQPDGEPVDVAQGMRASSRRCSSTTTIPAASGSPRRSSISRQQVVEHAVALVAGCECSHGCPACVGPILASDETRGCSPKRAALVVLDLLRAEDRSA